MIPPRLALFSATCALLAACAKEEPPPGTRPDNAPPRPVELRPDYAASVPGFDGSASIRFDEPLSNPRNLGRDLVGSPAGRYEVSPGRSGLEVRPEEGWRADVVYYLLLPAGVSDLLRNQTTAPVEWLFSTGGPVPETEVTGRAIDRVTARGTRGLRVLFLSSDSVPYTAVSDTGGVFRLPGLPAGDYEAIAFQDQDRDFTYDEQFEPGGVEAFSIGPEAPSPAIDVFVLPADSTPPVLLEAEVRDSVTIRLGFDDPLDPEIDLSGVSVTVRDSASDEELAIDTFAVGNLEPLPLPEVEGEDEPAGEEAGIDEPDADDRVGLDEAVGAAEDAIARAAAGGIPDLAPAPAYLTVRLVEPLVAGTYQGEVEGVANLRALEGGGAITFGYEPPDADEAPTGGEDP